MVGICFDHYQGLTQTQWSYLASSFGITDRWERGCGDASSENGVVQIGTADDLPTEPSLVVLSPANGAYIQGTVSLEDFVHPANAIYLFGGDHVHLSSDDLGSRVADHIVYIPNATPYNMHAVVAAAVVLWDRQMKLGDLIG